jgi:hypothetical protein
MKFLIIQSPSAFVKNENLNLFVPHQKIEYLIVTCCCSSPMTEYAVEAQNVPSQSTSQPIPSTSSVSSWPFLYRLPQFPPTLQHALDKQDPEFHKMGRSSVRSDLLQVLFDDITAYTWLVDIFHSVLSN